MTTYTITYTLEMEAPANVHELMEAYYWHQKVIRDPNLELPSHVESVQTTPDVVRS